MKSRARRLRRQRRKERDIIFDREIAWRHEKARRAAQSAQQANLNALKRASVVEARPTSPASFAKAMAVVIGAPKR